MPEDLVILLEATALRNGLLVGKKKRIIGIAY
jgi:hypothetical protein